MVCLHNLIIDDVLHNQQALDSISQFPQLSQLVSQQFQVICLLIVHHIIYNVSDWSGPKVPWLACLRTSLQCFDTKSVIGHV